MPRKYSPAKPALPTAMIAIYRFCVKQTLFPARNSSYLRFFMTFLRISIIINITTDITSAGIAVLTSSVKGINFPHDCSPS